MELKDLKEQEIINSNGEKENVIKYFSLSDIYITDRSLNIGSPRNEEYFDNVEEAISNLLDRDAENSPIHKFKTDFVENIVYENTIILDENTRRLYNNSENLADFEEKVREKYYKTNFKREYVAPYPIIYKPENRELYIKFLETQEKKAENFIDDLRDYDFLNDKKAYDMFKDYYVHHTSIVVKEHLENNEFFKDFRKMLNSERVEFDKKNKPKEWNENDQRNLDELISILNEEKPIEIESETFSMVKEKLLYFSEEKKEYVRELIKKIMPLELEYANVYSNYMELSCKAMKKQEDTYEEAVMREQEKYKKSPEFEEKIKNISKCLGFSGKINFEEKLRETLLNKKDTERFSIPIVLENKKTGDTASFNIKIEYVIEDTVITYRPALFDYDLTLKKKNGEEKTMNFDFSNGKMLNAKEAISVLEKEMEIDKKEEVYAYLVDDYGFETDISSKIRKITEEDIDRNTYFRKNEEADKTQFKVDVYGEMNLKGTLVTNAIYVECNESSISGIKAPKAEVINCAYCENLEEVNAPNCKELHIEECPELIEENINVAWDCEIEGLEKRNQLKR